jgi:muconolactone delta-isomerase
MDFLVELEIHVPEGIPESEVRAREDAESAAAAELVDQEHLIRLWNRHVAPGESRPIRRSSSAFRLTVGRQA